MMVGNRSKLLQIRAVYQKRPAFRKAGRQFAVGHSPRFLLRIASLQPGQAFKPLTGQI